MSNTIQVKQGLAINIPVLASGEPAFCTDTKEVFFGDGTSNYQVLMHQEFNANTFLAANADDTPVAVSVSEQRILGRKTGGNIGALTNAEIMAILSGGAGASFAMNSQKITGLANGVDSGDAVNKGQLDNVIASNDAMVFKGTVGSGGTVEIAAFNSLATYNVGWTYKVIEEGTIKGKTCEIGDTLISMETRAGSGNVDADWMAVQANLDGAVIGPASATNNNIAVYDGVTGKIIKDGGVTISGLATSTHTHGGISNDGKIGSSSGIPIITGADGILQAGSFGTASGTFCQGNDSRLSDARTPTSHTHGGISNDGKIGTTANLIIKTGTAGVLEALSAGTNDQFLRGDGTWQTVTSSDTATAADNILDGSNTGTEITYAPYSTAQAADLKFYTHATAPTGTSRLNIGAYFHATQLYEGDIRVLNQESTIDGGSFI